MVSRFLERSRKTSTENIGFFIELDDLKTHTTKDGSLSLYSLKYNEGFHDTDGALKESINKYLLPSQLNQLPKTNPL